MKTPLATTVLLDRIESTESSPPVNISNRMNVVGFVVVVVVAVATVVNSFGIHRFVTGCLVSAATLLSRDHHDHHHL